MIGGKVLSPFKPSPEEFLLIGRRRKSLKNILHLTYGSSACIGHKNRSRVRYSRWDLFQLYGPQIWVGGKGMFLIFLGFPGLSQVPDMFPDMFSHFYPIYFAHIFSLSHPRGRHPIFQLTLLIRGASEVRTR
jgi:hypothetical protein